VTVAPEISPVAQARFDALLDAGYRIKTRGMGDALSLSHPSRRRRRGAPPALLIYPDGLVITYPRDKAQRQRFGADSDARFREFLAGVPRPSQWEIAAPFVERGLIFVVLTSLLATVLWGVYEGQIVVISLLVHLVLFAVPFVAIRLFLK